MNRVAAHARPRVILTDPIHPDAREQLAQAADVMVLPTAETVAESHAALRSLLADAHGLIVRRQLPDDIFDAPGRLCGVVRHGVGLDFIPVARATTQHIPVANTPGVNANAVAEYVFAAMLATTRRLAEFDRQVRQANWASRWTAATTTFELRGRTIGIIGYGAIGKRVGEIAMLGFGMKVAAHTATPSRLPAGVNAMALDALVAASDFVVVACPLTPETRGMVNRDVLACAKPGCVLINVGRGPVVRQDDVADALAAGRLKGAVLDVFEVQPLPQDSPLRNHPGVLLTPHLAGITQDAERAMGMMAAETMLALIRGERPDNTVNKIVWA